MSKVINLGSNYSTVQSTINQKLSTSTQINVAIMLSSELNSYQSMEKDENKESSDGAHSPASSGSRNCREKSGAVIAKDDSVVGDTYNGEHEKNHDGSETP